MSTILANNIVYGGHGPSNYLYGTKSLGELSIRHLTIQGNTMRVIDGFSGEVRTTLQIRDSAIRVADLLIKLYKVTHKDCIGICSENHIDFPSIIFGTIMTAATLAPINNNYTEREMDHAWKLSKPRIVFASPSTIDRVVNVAKQNSFIKVIVVFGRTSSYAHVQDFESFKNNSKIQTNVQTFQCAPQDIRKQPALILCSSGTTGMPKGVQLSQISVMIGIAQHFESNTSYEDNLVNNNYKYISVIPWFHSYGCISLIGICFHKTEIVFFSRFEDKAFLGGIEKYKVNAAVLVPPLMVLLAKHPIASQYDLSSIKIAYCGAAPLSREVEDLVKSRHNITCIRNGYGMTEGSLSFTAQSHSHQKPGSVGTLRMGSYARVIDADTGRNLGPYEQGELCFKSESNMMGYVDDIKATQETIDSDGWLHTGDVGYYDSDAEFFIVDRLKELIKYKGFQVPPAEIEDLLLQHPAVADSAVIGIPDDESGELPLAFIVRQKDVNVTEKDIIDFIAGLASPPKRLHGGVIFIDAIPKSATGKILRKDLRAMIKEQKSKL